MKHFFPLVALIYVQEPTPTKFVGGVILALVANYAPGYLGVEAAEGKEFDQTKVS